MPSLFLAIAMLEFFLILLDRMVYTAKALGSKLVLQWVTVLGFHIWIFFVLPSSKQYVRACGAPACPSIALREREREPAWLCGDAGSPSATMAFCQCGTWPSVSTGTLAPARCGHCPRAAALVRLWHTDRLVETRDTDPRWVPPVQHQPVFPYAWLRRHQPLSLFVIGRAS